MEHNNTLVGRLKYKQYDSIILYSNFDLCVINLIVADETKVISHEYEIDKFALLWGEAQLCLPYHCL